MGCWELTLVQGHSWRGGNVAGKDAVRFRSGTRVMGGTARLTPCSTSWFKGGGVKSLLPGLLLLKGLRKVWDGERQSLTERVGKGCGEIPLGGLRLQKGRGRRKQIKGQ